LVRHRRLGEETLYLIREAAALIKATEDRRQLLADEQHTVASNAIHQLELAEDRVRSLEAEVLEAERRANSAEEWLDRAREALERNLSEYSPERDRRAGSRAA
jgi:hypothetical protein